MSDIFSKEKRSEIMSKIRPKNTLIEVSVFRALRKQSLHFQKHYSKAPGCPDIALPRKKKAIFIDGDFWHGYNLAILHKNNLPYFWEKKILRNIERDEEINTRLSSLNWKILRIWEHEIKKDFENTIAKVIDFIK